MIASEIASGKPRGQTYADERISLLVESATATEIVGSIVEKVVALKEPTLSEIAQIVDQYFVRDTTILLMVQAGSTLHIVTRGQGTLFLKRNDKAVPLLSNNSSASGPVITNDIFFLAGQTFLSAVTPSVFIILLEKTKESEVEAKIVAYLEQNTQTDTLCLLLQNAPVANDDLVIHEILEKKPRKLILPTFKVGNFFSSFSPSSKQQKLTIIIGGILLFLLIASLVFGSRERERIGTAREFEEIKTEVSQQITEAEQLVDITPEQAAPILSKARETLTSKESEFPSESPHHEEFNGLVAKVNELSDRANRKYAVVPTVFFDITWIKEGAIATSMTLSENALFLLDTEQGAVYEVGLEQKKSAILGTSELFKDGIALSLFQDKPYSFVEGGSPKVVNEKGEETIAHNNWGQIVDNKSFGGNIYLLDRNNQIWKYPGSESGFGSGSTWLVEDAIVDFSKAESFAIDGNIWVLSTTGINKLAIGGQDPFFLKNENVSNGRKIWTSENSKYLYVLENSRIVVFDKDGSYREQYIWDGFSDTTDFAISEPLNKILILQKDKIYVIDRK